jgi:hypothetical protein
MRERGDVAPIDTSVKARSQPISSIRAGIFSHDDCSPAVQIAKGLAGEPVIGNSLEISHFSDLDGFFSFSS